MYRPYNFLYIDRSRLSICVAATSRMDVCTYIQRTITSTGLHRCTGNRMAILLTDILDLSPYLIVSGYARRNRMRPIEQRGD